MTNSIVDLDLRPRPPTASRLVIIGARPFGRETCNYAREAGWTVKGFLDDKADALQGIEGYPPILGPVESCASAANYVFVCVWVQ